VLAVFHCFSVASMVRDGATRLLTMRV